MEKFKSRKLWLSILAAIALFSERFWGIVVPNELIEAIINIALPVAGAAVIGNYVRTEGMLDKQKIANSVLDVPNVDIPQTPAFDIPEFDKQVRNSVSSRYGVKNDATVFYNAMTLGQDASFMAGNWINVERYWNYIVDLGHIAYKFVHGEPIEECKKKLMAEKNCEVCEGWDLKSHCLEKGVESYAVLLQLLDAEENLADVKALVEEGGDMVCKETLYYGGELARYYLKSS